MRTIATTHVTERVEAIRFVTPDEFSGTILPVVERHRFPDWFHRFLRADFATGCRPAELVGSKGRAGREEEEGGAYRISRMKPHHGLRANDVRPNFRFYVEGKNTTPVGRTYHLKPRVVLCADKEVHREIAEVAARAEDRNANLFLPGSRDGIRMQRIQMNRLQKLLPARFSEFSARWLRHSHAIAALRAGVDLVSLQRQLGHANLATTAIYLRYAGIDDARYLDAFSGGGPAMEKRDCPSCGFAWNVDPRTGAMDLGSRVGVVFRRARG